MIQTMDLSRSTMGIAAGVAGTLLLGYCIYFDHKRRKDPEYKKKVRERRRKQKKATMMSQTEMPNVNDQEAVQRFLLQEIQMGEMLISSGDIEGGVEHLANAVVVCGQPAQLLQVLQQTLPAQIFMALIQRMKQYGNQKPPSSESAEPKRFSEDLADDDLE